MPEAFLLDLRNQDFVEGKGPYPITDAAGRVHILNRMAQASLSLGLILAITAAVLYPRGVRSAIFITLGPTFVVIAGIFAGTGKLLKNYQVRQERLRDHGVILPGELVKMAEDNSDSSIDNLTCSYLFKNPGGAEIQGKCGGRRAEIKKKDFPAPGTPLWILYVDDDLHRAL